MYYEVDDFKALDEALKDICGCLKDLLLCEQTVFDCRLIASELLSNALEHGGGKAVCRVSLDGGILRVSVKDATPFAPPRKTVCPDVTSERGRGLFLVDRVGESRSYSEQEGISVTIRVAYRK